MLFWRHWSTVSPGFLFWYSVIQLSRHLLENNIQIQGSHFPFLFNVADQSYRCAPARLSQGLVVLAHFKHPFFSSLRLPVSSVLFRFRVCLNCIIPVLKSSVFQSCCLSGYNLWCLSAYASHTGSSNTRHSNFSVSFHILFNDFVYCLSIWVETH